MLSNIREIISGKQEITDRLRFEIARVGVGAVHVILLVAFFYIGCYPLAIFNCFSVFFYSVIIEILLRQEKYMATFASTYLEIVLHSFFACVMIGWSSAFGQYNIGLIYVAYYFSYITPAVKRKILFPTILGMINLVLTWMMRYYSYVQGHLYTDYTEGFLLFISIMNIFVAAIMIMFFATLHTIEIRRKAYQLHAANEKLNKLAYFDALTKLRNRNSMAEELHAILGETEEDYCFIMGDIDDFKQFNDTYGHACGDYVLQEVAAVVIRNMGERHIACRWGGEEILILLKGNFEYSRIIAEKIRYEVEHMNASFKGTPIQVTMTFGVSAYSPEKSFERCISLADKRLYQGKQNGKNCVVSE